MTSLVLMHVKSMSGNGTLRRKRLSSSPGSLMSVIKKTRLRSLPHLKVVLHAPSPTGLLWTLSLGLGPKTRTTTSQVSPFADLPNSPPTSLVWAHNPKIKPLTETRKPLPLTGPIPATKDNAVKTGSPKVPSQYLHHFFVTRCICQATTKQPTSYTLSRSFRFLKL